MRFIRKGVPPKERELDGKVEKRRQKEQMTTFSPKGRDKGRRDEHQIYKVSSGLYPFGLVDIDLNALEQADPTNAGPLFSL